MFLVKKIIGILLLPLSVATEMLVIGVVLLWFSKKQKGGRWFVTFGFLVLLLCSTRTAPYFLLKPLESQYKPLITRQVIDSLMNLDVKWIVVLGGGHNPNPNIPLTSQISAMSLVRLSEGVRLYRKLPECKLIVSGGNYFGESTEADVLAQMAGVLGVRHEDVVLESASYDTDDQARNISLMVKRDNFILVTSAAHMPRAMGMFMKAGMDPIPGPTDYLMKSGTITPGNFYPNAEVLEQTRVAVYEYLGIAWAKLRGKI